MPAQAQNRRTLGNEACMVKMSTWKTKKWTAWAQRMRASQQNPEEEPVSTTMAFPRAYIVCLKVTQISDDSNPDKER